MAQEEEAEESEDDMILNFGNDQVVHSPSQAKQQEIEKPRDEVEDVAPLGGLWGSPRPPGHAEQIREAGQKRRWTVSERALHD